MKEYQKLLGSVVIAVAIIIAGIVVANALADGFNTLRSSIVYHGEIIALVGVGVELLELSR